MAGVEPSRGSGRRATLIGACLAVTLVAAVLAGTRYPVHRPAVVTPGGSKAPTASGSLHGSAGRIPPGTAKSQVPADPAAAIGVLLRGRATALRDGDRAGWLTALDPAAPRFRTAQGQVFDRVRELRPAAWSYQVLGGTDLPVARRGVLGGTAWLAHVQLDYRLVPGGPTVQHDEYLTVVRRAGGWRFDTDTDGATTRDIWDLGPVSHATAARCLVVGAAARQAQVTQLAGECDAEAAAVDAAWGTGWDRQTVITMPDTLEQLAVLLGRTSGVATSGSAGSSGAAVQGAEATAGLSNTAAVTIGPGDGPADEVLVNGGAFNQLRALGRRVVMTHEMVHVATRGTGSRNAPTWLEEGFADYVAYRHSGLSDQQVAGDALTAVRAGRVPAGLPSTNDFNAAGNGAAAAYGQAWVAVSLIAAKAGGTERMKTFYQQVGAPADGASDGGSGRAAPILDAALARIGLHDTATLVRLWQAQLRRLAG